jgi:hypothetical protein
MPIKHTGTQKLLLHPQSATSAVEQIVAGATRQADGVSFYFAVVGDMTRILAPEGADDLERRDELWRTTCFEAFVRSGDDEGYMEFNFSTSNYWAAYQFDRYREGMRSPDMIEPVFDVDRDTPGRLMLFAFLHDGQVMDFPADRPLKIALTAVIEEMDGTKSYWSLAHPPGAPDFHHAENFALELP